VTDTDWSSILEPYGRLIVLRILGREFLVPENNLFMRCFQFLAPERVPYGDFCWNAQCFNCRCTLKRAGAESSILTCQTYVEEGDELTEISPQVADVLAAVLKASNV
jgi:hypothetical protein